jgi:hypothetical protein
VVVLSDGADSAIFEAESGAGVDLSSIALGRCGVSSLVAVLAGTGDGVAGRGGCSLGVVAGVLPSCSVVSTNGSFPRRNGCMRRRGWAFCFPFCFDICFSFMARHVPTGLLPMTECPQTL